jgi:plastocyanin
MRGRGLWIGVALACAAACSSGTNAASTTGPGNNNPGPGAGGNNNDPPPANTVDANTNDTFDPSSLTVAVGTTVTFAFGAVGHNVTFSAVAGSPADIPGTNANTSIDRQFTTAGTFPYHCTIHAGMSGTITVQ